MNTTDMELLGALVGLARASEGDMYLKESTASLLARALVILFNGEEQEKEEMVRLVHDEKYALVPDCRYCASPCGRTTDYHVESMRQEPEEVQEKKEELLKVLKQCYQGQEPSPQLVRTTAVGLFKTGETGNPEYYDDVLKKLREFVKKSTS